MYFLKGLLRVPILILKIILIPLILFICIILSIVETIERLGGKPYNDFTKTRKEIFINWMYDI